MSEDVDNSVDSILKDNPDCSKPRAYAIAWSQKDEGETEVANAGFVSEVQKLDGDDTLMDDEAASVVVVSKLAENADNHAVKAVAYRTLTGQWGGFHPAEKTNEGREHLLDTYKSNVDNLVKEFNRALDDVRENDEEVDSEENVTVDKSSDDLPTVKFKMESTTGIMPLFKGDDGDMVIWGPASVEVVDKEGDRIRGEALENALPQLLRRQRLSLEHSDQLVGEILESFETDEEITVEVDGKTFTRNEFPTDVLEMDDMETSLFVAGKVWDDTRQSRQAQEDIENGDIDSYSISGESLVATTKYEEGDVVNDIKELDLSAVTLCEEGMNQKAKFGVVSKANGDTRDTDEGDNDESVQAGVSKGTRGSAGIHANGEIQIVKNMSEDETPSDEDEDVQETVSLDDVREEFKNVVDEALPDDDLASKSDIVSKDELESFIEEKTLGKDEIRSIAQKTAEEVFAEKAGDDFPPEEEDEEDEEEMSEDEPPVDEDEPEVDEEVAPEEEEEPPEDKGDEDFEDEPPMDEEDDDEEMKGYDHSDLEEMLPEDLYEAVREYLDEEPDEGEPGNPVEASDSDDDGALTEDDVEKMIEERFGDEMVLDSPSGPTEEVQKSWADEDEPETDDQVGPAAQQLYEN